LIPTRLVKGKGTGKRGEGNNLGERGREGRKNMGIVPFYKPDSDYHFEVDGKKFDISFNLHL
jgi:hypothetical protein